MQPLLNQENESQQPSSYRHIYGHSTAGCYNSDPPTMIEDVNFTRAYGEQKLQPKNNPLSNTYNEVRPNKGIS